GHRAVALVLLLVLIVIVALGVVVIVALATAVDRAGAAVVVISAVVGGSGARVLGVALVLVEALDLGPVGDRAGDRVAVHEHDLQHVVLKRNDLARVLVRVLDAVLVRVGLARVHAKFELGAVAQPVAVLVPARLVDLQRQAVVMLPAVGNPVVVAVA